jgi:hypothetical protein
MLAIVVILFLAFSTSLQQQQQQKSTPPYVLKVESLCSVNPQTIYLNYSQAMYGPSAEITANLTYIV